MVSERQFTFFYMQHQCNSFEMYTDDRRADVVVALQPSSIDNSLPYIFVLYIVPNRTRLVFPPSSNSLDGSSIDP